ncbi:MAG: hypothetical protein M1294_14250 [Firmicutes bacterium]|uniref:Uncharacterized protein n=1 Tax=Sulfobacillus benefaciens TaxID=453960 RepID=A0A2T2WV46_9FIRM|nr:hypothetical protein [Bacillota bacterium]PSR26105.1 MAG: hypothetical protein C7B43_14940 [Sulfobacillus benefaciens]HBQ95736.1 hypothetical protein [Sulfobacillus sp.]
MIRIEQRVMEAKLHDICDHPVFLQQLTYTLDLADCDSALSLLVTPQSFETITHDLTRLVQDWAHRRLRPSSSTGRWDIMAH